MLCIPRERDSILRASALWESVGPPGGDWTESCTARKTPVKWSFVDGGFFTSFV